MSKRRRLFFGMQVQAAWPAELPSGRTIPEETRHLTLAFLGDFFFPPLEEAIERMPLPPFSIGPAGLGSHLIFLPHKQAHCVALEIRWLEDPKPLFSFQQELSQWIEKTLGLPQKEQPFFPHITIARAPFNRKEWEEHFKPVPFFLSALHLYESLGNLEYRPLKSYPFLPPFIALDHTADIAFEIRGASLEELFLHAQLALFFSFPPLSQFYTPAATKTLDEIIIGLNRIIALADEECGCPFKAVSFHGKVVEKEGLFIWEMIVDV